MTAGVDQYEIELTLRLDPEAASRLARRDSLPELRAGRMRRRRLVSTYFDTPDGLLRTSRIALRIRQDGKRFVQTVKTAAADTGPAIRRGEWECGVSEPVPDLRSLGDERELRHVFGDAGLAAALQPVYTTDFTRTTIPLRVGDSRLDLAIDVGEIRVGEATEPVCEAEIELRRGAVADVYAVAQALRREVAVRLEPLSKSERAYFLTLQGGVRPLRAKRPRMERDVSLGDAFLAIARSCLIQLRANAAAVERGDDPEGMHQLRVALRRLRSAFSAFGAAMPGPARRRFAASLKRLARTTDAARELDVFLAEILVAVRKAVGRDSGLAAVEAAAREARARAWARVRAALAGDLFVATVLDLEAWLEGGGWRLAAGDTYAHPAEDYARRVLKRLHRKLARAGERLAELSEPELHDVRLRAKKLRYAGEFFRDLFAAKAAKRYLAALADVQDHLGALNDSVTVRALLQRLGRRRLADAAGFERGAAVILGWSGARVSAELDRLPETWRAFLDCRAFWK
ncbi:MAG: CHAD domain-containing protein [Alphaproteobacteria bacterium]|nr:CHAD domain-containing protein [Alphaproteobacteria bacterium]